MKRRFTTICFVLATSLLTVEANNNIIYENGVKDTLSIGVRYAKDLALVSSQNSSIFLDGFGVVLNANPLPESKIIQATAIGLKNGFNVKFIKVNNTEFIVFNVEKREADALYLVDRLNKYGLSPSVEKLNGTYPHVVLVAHELFKTIQDTVSYLNVKKDDTIKKLTQALESKEKNVNIDNTYEIKTPVVQNTTQNIVLDLSSLQVVNRVVTESYLKKHNIKAESLEPHSRNEKVNKASVQNQIKKVTTNIKTDQKANLPNIDNFNKAYSYLREHAGITKDNQLVLHKTVFKTGDKLFAWTITNINYNIGIITLGDGYAVPVSKR